MIRFRIAREGRPILLCCALSSGTLMAITLMTLSVIVACLAVSFILVTVILIWFLRDPDREPPRDNDVALSPADGRVIRIERAEDGGNAVSIFLSLFNVHVNRVPVSGTVKAVRRIPGRYFHAAGERARTKNAQVEVELDSEFGLVSWKQVSGLMVRRIACHLQVGQRVVRGERFGMIYLGSRMDLQLPACAELCAEPGIRVRGGQTIVARFNSEGVQTR